MKSFLQFVLVAALIFCALSGIYLIGGGRLPAWAARLVRRPAPVAESGPPAFTPAQTAPVTADVSALELYNRASVQLVRSVVPSVVSIATRRVIQRQVTPLGMLLRQLGVPVEGGGQAVAGGEGSGVIISKEGHIVTNDHVIRGMTEVSVMLSGGETYDATLIGTDPVADIAVLQIHAPDPLQPLPLGNSDEVEVGSLVYAVGNPFGLHETVSDGIVSAIGRPSEEGQGDFIQTNAMINPGNSGGPLVNIRGEVIGINRMIYSADGAERWQGIGFAIPSNSVRIAVDGLLRNGRLRQGYLGLSTSDRITPELRRRLGLDPGQSGVLVTAVDDNSPAEAAGLRPGDLITAASGKPVRTKNDLRGELMRVPVGGSVTFSLLRQGRAYTATVEMGERGETP